MPRYHRRDKSPFTEAEVNALGPELAQLAESDRGSVDDTVEYARSHPSSALYTALQMDRPESELVERHYRERARLCWRSIEIEWEETGERVRAFHSIEIEQEAPTNENDRRSQRVYMTVSQVRSDADRSRQVVERARLELNAWRRRHAQHKKIFGPVFDAIDALSAP
jgi:hypothetical protein